MQPFDLHQLSLPNFGKQAITITPTVVQFYNTYHHSRDATRHSESITRNFSLHNRKVLLPPFPSNFQSNNVQLGTIRRRRQAPFSFVLNARCWLESSHKHLQPRFSRFSSTKTFLLWWWRTWVGGGGCCLSLLPLPPVTITSPREVCPWWEVKVRHKPRRRRRRCRRTSPHRTSGSGLV